MSSEVATVDTVVEQDMNFTVVARNPGEMASAQKSLILWAARKIQAEKELLNEAQEQIDIAVKSKWKTSAWKRRVNLSIAKIEFYKKIKMALEAGYYIVPPFPIDVFAVRTDRKTPSGISDNNWTRTFRQNARLLPAGEGRYVSDQASAHTERWTEEKDGKEISKVHKWADEFLPVDFPFKLAKPAVLNATAEAMSKRIFDTMGILPSRRSADPVICGQIFKPDTYKTPITFFVAWWLDTKTL